MEKEKYFDDIKILIELVKEFSEENGI